MDRSVLLKNIREDGPALVEQFLPTNAGTELDNLLSACRHEVDPNEFLMFMAVRSLLRRDGMSRLESDREAGCIMALLKEQLV